MAGATRPRATAFSMPCGPVAGSSPVLDEEEEKRGGVDRGPRAWTRGCWHPARAPAPALHQDPGHVYVPAMEAPQQRLPEDPAGEAAQLVQGKRHHQEVPCWPQHLLPCPQVRPRWHPQGSGTLSPRPGCLGTWHHASVSPLAPWPLLPAGAHRGEGGSQNPPDRGLWRRGSRGQCHTGALSGTPSPQVPQLPRHPGLSAEGQTGHPRGSRQPPDEPLRLLHGEEPQGGGFRLPPPQHPGRCRPLQHPGGCLPAAGSCFPLLSLPAVPGGRSGVGWLLVGRRDPPGAGGEPQRGVVPRASSPAPSGAAGRAGTPATGLHSPPWSPGPAAAASPGGRWRGGVPLRRWWGVAGGSRCRAEVGVPGWKGVTQLALLRLRRRSVATARMSRHWSTASSSRCVSCAPAQPPPPPGAPAPGAGG